MEQYRLESLATVSVVSTLLVEFLKQVLGGYAWYARLPIMVPVVLMNAALTLFASLVVHTLPGNAYDLVFQAVVGSIASFGVYKSSSSLQSLKETKE